MTYLKTFHGHVLTPKWKIVSIIVYKKMEKVPICENCKKFILSESELSDLSGFWADLKSQKIRIDQNISKFEPKQNCYKQFVGRTLGLSLEKPEFLATISRCRYMAHFNLLITV
jgi:hypothetical protein